MSKSKSVRDSDSSSSTSWTFVHVSEHRSETDANIVNTSNELTQELTMEYLNPTKLDQDTDSDGISIISEDEDFKANSPNRKQLAQDGSNKYNDVPIENISHHKFAKMRGKIYFHKYVVLLWIFTSITIPVLFSYFSAKRYLDKNNTWNKEMHQFDKSLTKKMEFIKTLYKGISYGKQILEDLDRQIIDQSNNDIYEKKIKYNFKDEVGVRRFASKVGGKSIKQEKSFEKQCIKCEHHNFDKVCKQKKYFAPNTKVNRAKADKTNNHKIIEAECSKYENHRNKDDISSDKKIRELQTLLKNKDKNIKQLATLLKSKNKQIKILEYKILKELNALRKPVRFRKHIDIENEKPDKEKVNRIPADWYYKLYKGRSKFRDQQHASDWIFKGANSRGKKENVKKRKWMPAGDQLRKTIFGFIMGRKRE